MKRTTGSHQLYLASSVSERTLVANSEERSQSILATLEHCRATLARTGDHESAHYVSVAILQHRMKLKGVSDLELRELCDALVADHEAAAAARDPRLPRQRRRRPPLLRVVK
jgi:hypothetical protein